MLKNENKFDYEIILAHTNKQTHTHLVERGKETDNRRKMKWMSKNKSNRIESNFLLFIKQFSTCTHCLSPHSREIDFVRPFCVFSCARLSAYPSLFMSLHQVTVFHFYCSGQLVCFYIHRVCAIESCFQYDMAIWFNMCLLWHTQIEYWLTCGSRETDTNKQKNNQTHIYTHTHEHASTRARACGRRQRKVHWSNNTWSSIDHLIIGYWMNWYVNSREKCILFFKEDRIIITFVTLDCEMHFMHTLTHTLFHSIFTLHNWCVSVQQSLYVLIFRFLSFSKLDAIIMIIILFFPFFDCPISLYA